MKLSEAIRLGEFALPPTYGAWFTRHLLTGKLCGGCAMGRALYAAGYRPHEMSFAERASQFKRHGEVGYFHEEYTKICAFVEQQWPWTAKGHLRDEGYNLIVNLISSLYEGYHPMPYIAEQIEALEATFDSPPAAVDAALQPEEVR